MEQTSLPLSLIDPDIRRRAWIAHALARKGRHIEPFESPNDLNGASKLGGIFLTCDTGNMVEQVVSRLSNTDQPVAVIAFSEQARLQDVVRAIKAGAVDYFDRVESGDELLGMIESVEQNIKPRDRQLVRRQQARERIEVLTPRERQVLTMVAMGNTNREIAASLGISHRTVEIHRSNILTKLGASNSPEAVRIAVDAGLIS